MTTSALGIPAAEFEDLRLSERSIGLAADLRGASFRLTEDGDTVYARRRSDGECFRITDGSLTTHDGIMRAIKA